MSSPTQIPTEVARRRTFAIVSHPDAGKTTLTEKLLLFGGAIQLAGAVKARKSDRHATSDWMAMEKARGISVTSSVMTFQYAGCEINLLDTPGHQDFSEDAYRVLTAVDSALLVIDAAKGVESQTEKLMDVCRMRHMPIITFINKLDREALPPLELMENLERRLKIECIPLTWPVGMGRSFKGVCHVHKKTIRFFTPTGSEKTKRLSSKLHPLDSPAAKAILADAVGDVHNDLALLAGAAHPFDEEKYLRGEQTPVFFGSAMHNFGVQELLDAFTALAPSPAPRQAVSRLVLPDEEAFSGFIFKIQANMDKAHHDRMAFVRICSGRFHKGMKLRHWRSGKDIAVNNAQVFMAQNRSGVEEAFAGDIIGIPNHGTLKIGDAFSEKEPLKFLGIPHFAPEHFKRVRLHNPLKIKQLQKGLTQLAEEGAVQLFRPLNSNEYILGAVGALQFDVVVARLADEYGVNASYEGSAIATARWVSSSQAKRLEDFKKHYQQDLALDVEGTLAYLPPNMWKLEAAQEYYPDLNFAASREIG